MIFFNYSQFFQFYKNIKLHSSSFINIKLKYFINMNDTKSYRKTKLNDLLKFCTIFPVIKKD